MQPQHSSYNQVLQLPDVLHVPLRGCRPADAVDAAAALLAGALFYARLAPEARRCAAQNAHFLELCGGGELPRCVANVELPRCTTLAVGWHLCLKTGSTFRSAEIHTPPSLSLLPM